MSLFQLAQPIRLLLEYTGTKFEDKHMSCGPAPDFDRSCWTNVKPTVGLDFANLPYYIDGKSCQTLINLSYNLHTA
jgi:glutathione S-transferase